MGQTLVIAPCHRRCHRSPDEPRRDWLEHCQQASDLRKHGHANFLKKDRRPMSHIAVLAHFLRVEAKPEKGISVSESDEASSELVDAIEVMRAKRQIDDAVADLASRPLSESAAAQMKVALADPSLAAARAALRRLDTSGRTPRAVVVTGSHDPATDFGDMPRLRVVPDEGGAL
jgi:hypothetical protein